MEKKKVWMVKTKVGRMRVIVLALGPTSFLSSLFLRHTKHSCLRLCWPDVCNLLTQVSSRTPTKVLGDWRSRRAVARHSFGSIRQCFPLRDTEETPTFLDSMPIRDLRAAENTLIRRLLRRPCTALVPDPPPGTIKRATALRANLNTTELCALC